MVRASDYYKYRTNTKVSKRKTKSGTMKSVPSYKLRQQKGLQFRDYSYLLLVVLVVIGLVNRSVDVVSKLEPVQTAQAAVQSTITPTPNISFLSFPTPKPTPQIKVVERVDERVEMLRDYLISKSSPFANHAQLIVDEADKYDTGWTQIVAIAGKESSFGRHIAPGSFNAWGIMRFDIVNGQRVRSIRHFKSWEEGIKYATQLLGESYKWNQNKAIQQKYCPDFECASNWTDTVTQTTREILSINE